MMEGWRLPMGADLAARAVADDGVLQQRHLAVEHGHVDEVAPARASPLSRRPRMPMAR